MNLHHLRYFLAITRTGGFTPAARTLNVTQPTVSSGIAELERILGVKVFNRSGHSVDLTMEGRTLLNYALQIEDLINEAEESLRQPNSVENQGFQFGAIDAAVIYLLPDVLQAYRDANPHIELSTQVAPSQDPRIMTLSLVKDEMPLVVGPDHHFTKRNKVSPNAVALESLILFHKDSVSRKLVDERFSELGITPRVAMEMRSPEAMRKLVESGLGISFLPQITVSESVAAGALCTVSAPQLRFEREIGLGWRKGRYFGPAIRDLIEAITDKFGKVEEWRNSQLSNSEG